MKEELMITTERIDDCVLLLGVMQLHLQHHAQQGLSWGWTASIW